MIPLALPDFPLVRDILTTGKLTIPYLETTGRFTESAVALFPNQPFLLHNSVPNWSLANPNPPALADVIATTQRLIQITKAPWFSIHLGFSAEEVRFEGCVQALSPALERQILFERMCTNLEKLKRVIDVPIIVENLDYNPSGAYEHICEPSFISAVVEQTQVGLLLDLAHAQVSAARFGIPIIAYLQQLPLQKIKQIHMSGPRYRGTTLQDAHEPLQEADYLLVQQVLTHASPRAITLEYYRSEGELIEQLRRLEGVVAQVS